MENGGLASETKDVHSCLCFTELVQLRGDPYLLHLHLPSRHSPGGGEELLEEAASDPGKRKNLGTQRSTPHTGNYRVQHKDLRQMSKDQHHSGKSPTRADPQLTRDLQSAIPTKICTPYVLWKQIKKSKQVSSSAFCSESG